MASKKDEIRKRMIQNRLAMGVGQLLSAYPEQRPLLERGVLDFPFLGSKTSPDPWEELDFYEFEEYINQKAKKESLMDIVIKYLGGM